VTVSQGIRGAVASAVTGRKGFKAELGGLRDRMRSLRQACRLARGRTLYQAAGR
jgi:hypothetical protein